MITRLDLGGAQQNTLDTLKAARASGFQGILVAGHGGELMKRGVRVSESSYIFSSLRHPVSPLWDMAALFQLWLLFLKINPDVVHTHSSKAGVLGRLAARWAGVPVVLHTVHGWSFNPTQSNWTQVFYRNLEKMLFGLSNGIIFVSNRDKKVLSKWNSERAAPSWLVRSAVDFKKFQPRGQKMKPKDFGFSARTQLVGCLGNLKPQKDPRCFIRAAKIIAMKIPNAGFVFAGEGPMRAALEAEIRKSGLESRFRLPGWIKKPEDFLRGLSLYLSSSAYEGLPRAVVQALRCGIPVVSTRAGGVEEIVKSGANGFLVPVGNASLLARHSVLLLRSESKRRRFARKASQSVGREFDVKIMVADLAKIYRERLYQKAN